MNTTKKVLCVAAAGFLAAVFLSGCATPAKQSSPNVSIKSAGAETPAAVEHAELTVANQGKSLVDQNGVEKFRATGDAVFGTDGEKLQGCMRCRNECIRYDSNGNCIQTIRSCTWDFDCGSTALKGSAPSMAKQSADIEKVELTVADHGKSLMDQNGVEKFRATGDAVFGTDGEKLQGCMRCTNECIRFDSNGKCIQTIRSCTWDFDCK